MKGDRPTKIKKGEKEIYFVNEVLLGEYKTEKVIEDYFCKYGKEMMSHIFGEKVVSIEKQKRVNGRVFGIRIKKTNQLLPGIKQRARVDILVKCKSGKVYAIEVKNPKRGDSNSSIYAISQLLYYSTLLPEITNLVVMSTKYDEGFVEVVKKFNLPIDFILFAKSQTFLLSK